MIDGCTTPLATDPPTRNRAVQGEDRHPSTDPTEDEPLKPENIELLVGAHSGELRAVSSALRQGANVDATDEYGKAALDIALYRGDVAMVRLLARHGANLRRLAPDDTFPMACAAMKRDRASIEMLTSFCADYESPLEGGRGALESVLVVASAHGSDDWRQVARYLIRHGADIECPNDHGQSLLCRMVMTNKYDAVTFLVENGANARSVDLHGYRPIDYAIALGSRQCALYLSKYSTSSVFSRLDDVIGLDTEEEASSSPGKVRSVLLGVASRIASSINRWRNGTERREKERSEQARQLMMALLDADLRRSDQLLDEGADPNVVDPMGQPAIFVAARSIYTLRRMMSAASSVPEIPADSQVTSLIEKMIAKGADPTVRSSESRRTLLHEACATSNEKLVELITGSGRYAMKPVVAPDALAEIINASDINLDRPLHAAVRMKMPRAIRMISNRGADINCVNRVGLSPLHIAAMNLDTDCATVLIDRGANVKLQTREGKTLAEMIQSHQDDAMHFFAMIEARDAIDSAMNIFSPNNPMSSIVRSMHGNSPSRTDPGEPPPGAKGH
jgi:ankyrin repeat protein